MNRDAKRTADAKIAAVLNEADSVVVRGLLPPEESEADTGSLCDRAAIQDLVAHLRTKEFTEPWFRGEREGEAFRDSIPCQCSGEFEFSFLHKKTLLARFTVHHWTHIRSEVLTQGVDEMMETESLDRLCALASRILPGHASRVQEPNQPLETTAPAGTPGAAQPLRQP